MTNGADRQICVDAMFQQRSVARRRHLQFLQSWRFAGVHHRVAVRNAATVSVFRPISLLAAGVVLFLSGTAASACPDVNKYQNVRSVSAEGLYQERRFSLQAGGPMDLGACSSVPGRGWITRGPDLRLDLSSNPRGRRLEIRVESECDAILLVNSPSGVWFFDDDSNGNLDPRFSINNARRGYWDIWVGRLNRSDPCDATLIVETF